MANLFLFLFLQGLPILGQPVTPTDTKVPVVGTTSPGTAIDPKGLSSPGQSSAKPFSTNSAGNTMSADSVAKEAPADYIYRTDDEIERLQRAIEVYNREFCPPQEPIAEVTEAAIGTLIKYQVLREAPKSLSELILRDGKVMRRVKKEVVPVQRGDAAGSLFGTLGTSVKAVNANSPKGKGTVVNDAPRLVEKRSMVRGPSGNLQEMVTQVPEPPPQVKAKVLGVPVENRVDAVRSQILSPQYRRTVPQASTTVPVPQN